MATLSAMTHAQRRQLLGTLFPKMREVVEAAWDFHRQLPYQIGWTKRAFRAPSRPDAVSPILNPRPLAVDQKRFGPIRRAWK